MPFTRGLQKYKGKEYIFKINIVFTIYQAFTFEFNLQNTTNGIDIQKIK